MVGANGTLALLAVSLATGIALAAPSHTALRVLQVVGGLFLIFLAIDAMRSAVRPSSHQQEPSSAGSPLLRGVFAVLLNPGAWVFLATTASALFAAAANRGGRALAVISALAILLGVACIDGPMVLAGHGIRRVERPIAQWLTPILAIGLAIFGLLLIIQGVRS
jgi:threonine efflux protein